MPTMGKVALMGLAMLAAFFERRFNDDFCFIFSQVPCSNCRALKQHAVGLSQLAGLLQPDNFAHRVRWSQQKYPDHPEAIIE